ncbi:hypothetical protein MMAD_55170 (plasmid) [Mycolicibacterium madagascariense]|uniref:DNA-binding protein n=1 Tax=Mycolicibacterium madagascariense TaxID=212765 RepID=A0A7I7XQA4_9MYCO|nr:OB-fold domain-containing protein [Mycolicibacterium madagascariense]BBZ31222.1 hypothetical protein MMAD_55170 [Mycolicibacterium madagascariense]
MSTEYPYGPTEDDEPFWRAARAGALTLQQCTDCAYVRWPAAGVCPECLSRASSWVSVEGRGTLWSFVVYHRAYAPAFKDDVPYAVGLVELECGARLVTRLTGVPPGAAVVGAPVAVQYTTVGEHGTVPTFAVVDPATVDEKGSARDH